MNNTTKEKNALKASKWSAILTLLGFLIVLGAIAYSALELSRLEKKKADLGNEIAEKETQLSKRKVELQELQSTLDYVRSKVEQAKVSNEQIDLAKQALTQVKSEATESKARIFIHIRDKSQSEITRKIAKALKEKGYVVPKEEILVDKGPNNTQVRYFREGEKGVASDIQKLLVEKFAIASAELTYIRGYETSTAIKPKTFEIWLSRVSS